MDAADISGLRAEERARMMIRSALLHEYGRAASRQEEDRVFAWWKQRCARTGNPIDAFTCGRPECKAC